MNLLQRFRLSRVNKMSNEAFLKQMRKPGDMNDFVNIVEWFASKRGCTSIKLSALCYYAYVWGLVFYNKEIAPFVFYKTEDGPVDKRISKIFGVSDKIITMGMKPKLSEELEKLLSLIWEKYSNYDGYYLMERAKVHYPFSEAQDVLLPKDMFLFYSWASMA